MAWPFFIILALVFSVSAGTTPPAGALVVGPGKQFKTIWQAVFAARVGNTIFIEPGIYTERLYIPEWKSDLTIIGASAHPESYLANQVYITGTAPKQKSESAQLEEMATVRAHANNFKMYNVNVVNTRGPGHSRIALSASGEQQGYYGCSFIGTQETLLSAKGRQIYVKCRIEGTVHFIFGNEGQSWFEQCNIKVGESGYIIANGRASPTSPSIFVLNKCKINGPSRAVGKSFLGRSWQPYSRAVVQNSELGPAINHEGWIHVTSSRFSSANVLYSEYNNAGPGASVKRAMFVKRRIAPVTRDSVLGPEEWIDNSY